jgi:hypothetical protein
MDKRGDYYLHLPLVTNESDRWKAITVEEFQDQTKIKTIGGWREVSSFWPADLRYIPSCRIHNPVLRRGLDELWDYRQGQA